MKKITALILSFAILISGLNVSAKKSGAKMLFDFETGSLNGFSIKSGSFGKLITNRSYLFFENALLDKQGRYFLSTLDLENNSSNDKFQGIIESDLFNVDLPYLTLLMGGGTSSKTYIAICDTDGNEVIHIRNSYVSQNLSRITVDVSKLVGKRAFIKIVDHSSEYYGFILADAFALVESEEKIKELEETSTLFYSDFSEGVIPAGFTDTDSWTVAPDPDNNLTIMNKSASGMSSILTVGDATWTDFSVKFKFKAMQLGTGAAIHVNFRTQDSFRNGYRLVVTANGNAAIRQVINNAYGDSSIVSSSLPSDINKENEFEIKVSSALIELYINGIKKGEGNNTLYKSGPVSFATWNMIAAFDDIEIKRMEKVVNVTGVTLPNNTLELDLGDTIKIKPTIFPEDATLKTVKYISRNLDVVTITPQGILRAVGPGEALLVVRTNDGNYEAECKITVKEKTFDDVQNHWAKDNISALASQGIISGMNEITFEPDSNLSGIQAFTLVSRMSEEGEGKYSSKYDFNFNNYIKRQEFFALCGELYQKLTGLKRSVGDVSTFGDSSQISSDYLKEINVLEGLGILNGDENGLLNPEGNLTRAEASKILNEIYKALNQSAFQIASNNADIGFGIRSPMNFKLFEPNQDIVYFVRGKGKLDGCKAEISFVDKQTEQVQKEEIILLGDKFETEGKFSADKNGVYEIRYVFVGSDGLASEAKVMQVGVCPKAERTADDYFYYGIQPHVSFAYSRTSWDHNYEGMRKDETLDLSFDLMEWLGVNLVREGITALASKEDAVKSPEEWAWEYSDELMKHIRQNSMTFEMILNNKGAQVKEEYKDKAQNWDAVPKSTESILHATGIIMDRYKNDKIIYQFGNESNYPSFFIGTEQEYVEQLEAFAKFIKSKDKNAVVASSGLVPDGPKDENIFYQGISKIMKEGYIDHFAYHSHGSFEILKDHSFLSMNGYAKTANLEWKENALLDESGMDIADKKEQANQIIRKHLWAYGNNHKGTVLFKLRQYPELASPGGMGGWAVTSNTGDIRETFIAYSALIRFLDGTQSVKQISNDKAFVFEFQKPDERVIVAFTDDNSQKFRIEVENDQAKVYNIYGNAIEKSDSYTIGKEPIYIVGKQVSVRLQ